MRFIKWLMSHVLLFAVLVVLAIGVWQHDQVLHWYQKALSEFHGRQPAATASANKAHPAATSMSEGIHPAKPEPLKSGSTAATLLQSPASAKTVTPAANASVAPSGAKQTAELKPAEPKTAESKAVSHSSDKDVAQASAVQAISPVVNDTGPVATAPTGTHSGAAPSVPSPPPGVSIPPPLTQSQRQLLAQARAAFWAQKMEASFSDYRKLTRERPDDPDLHGEFGNALLAARRLKSARKQFIAAAHGLLQQHRYVDFNRLAQSISVIDPDSVNVFRAMIHGAVNAGSTGTVLQAGSEK